MPALLQLFFHFIGNGLHLARGISGTEQKVVGKGSDLGNIKNHQIVCLFIIRRIHGNFQSFIHLSP